MWSVPPAASISPASATEIAVTAEIPALPEMRKRSKASGSREALHESLKKDRAPNEITQKTEWFGGCAVFCFYSAKLPQQPRFWKRLNSLNAKKEV